MKTTIEISNSLLEEARKLAAKERATVRALVEQGLRQIVAERKSRGAFKVRKATFKGQGLQTGFAGATWEQMRETITRGGADDHGRHEPPGVCPSGRFSWA